MVAGKHEKNTPNKREVLTTEDIGKRGIELSSMGLTIVPWSKLRIVGAHISLLA